MSTELDLPSAIARYFAAKESSSGEPAEELFTDDIVILDKGEDTEITGRAEVAEWLGRTNDKYKLTTELKSSEQKGDALVVRTVVSGDFPGSPYAFDYHFMLREDRIAKLAIDPVGPVEEL